MWGRRSRARSSAACRNSWPQSRYRWAGLPNCHHLHQAHLSHVLCVQGRLACVLCNLKPRKLAGVSSNGMLLCASNAAHDKVETLAAPAGCEPGEPIYAGERSEQDDPMSPNQVLVCVRSAGAAQRLHSSAQQLCLVQIQKKKVFEALQPDLHTSHNRLAMWKDAILHTRHGPVTAPTLSDAHIS